ncbi:MAG: ATP-binding protein [Defluviicoccus sp.]|nr:ATP-binding protein [Defluviicoccus sp.]
MTVIARKYNPGFLTDDELVASFCVRTKEFESMIEALRECTGSANTHQIVIGPRGSGKTSLLLRVAAEIRRDERLTALFSPVVFAEESYEVSTAGEFWLECLSRLADQGPSGENGQDLRSTFQDLRQIRDDRTLGDRCLGALQDFADRENKRLVLVVENLNMLLEDIGDDDTGWQLRHVLQTEPRIVLLASATSRFDAIDDPKRPFFDLFRVLALRPLDRDDCATLWQEVSGQCRVPETIQALRILTGGSPRLLTIVARFGANLSFRELMADLLDLVDDHTEYFKSHLDALPAQERKVYLALVQLWKPVPAREIADRARLETSQCSAQLKRLTERGVVEMAGGSERRKLYYVAERLYNIYYLIRRARGPDPMIEALIRFMEAYYSVDELREFGTRMTREAFDLDGDTLGLYRIAFGQLVQLPSMVTHREELLSLAPVTFGDRKKDLSIASVPLTVAEGLFDKALTLAEEGRLQDAVDIWDEVVRRFGTSTVRSDLEQVSLALIKKGNALGRLQRPQEALAAWDEVVERFGESQLGHFPNAVATALLVKAAFLGSLNRWDEVLVACNEVLHRSGKSDTHPLLTEVSLAMTAKGAALARLSRLDEAVIALTQLVERFGDSQAPEIVEQVAAALGSKTSALIRLNRPKEALAVTEEVMHRFGGSDAREVQDAISGALVSQGALLLSLDRDEEASEVWREVIRRFKSGDSLKAREAVQTALLGMATTELASGQVQTAITVVNRMFQRNGVVSPEIEAVANMILAGAHLVEGDMETCVQDIETVLVLLPKLKTLSKGVLYTLSRMAGVLGPETMHNLIKASPASDLLLPMTTALEKDIGLEPRVAKEVEEVAEDIRRDLEELRKAKLGDGGTAALHLGSRPG